MNQSNSYWNIPNAEGTPPDAISENSIPARFFALAQKQPSRWFARHRHLDQDGWDITLWEQAAGDVSRLALFLREHCGVSKGDKVAIFSATRYEWIIADLAILATGAVSVPIYQTLTSPEAGYILWDSEADVVFVENQEQYEKIAEVAGEATTIPQTENFEGGDVQVQIRAAISFETIQKPSPWLSAKPISEILAAKSSLQPEPALSEECEKITRSDLASIVYTSGTTGPPKGVIQTHGNHLAMLDMVILSKLLGTGTGAFLYLPLAHSFARLIAYVVIGTGGDLIVPSVVSREKTVFDAKRLLVDIRETNPSVFPSVPRLFEKIMSGLTAPQSQSTKEKFAVWVVARYLGMKRSKKKNIFLPLFQFLVDRVRGGIFGTNIAHGVSGGAPISVEVLTFFRDIGLMIYEGYGLTETTPALTANTPYFCKFGTVGRLFDGAEVRISETDGEILARGGNVAHGYLNKPQATSEAWLEDGWFATGDVGEIDDEGYLRITDRKKEIIVNAGGKNIAPARIEGRVKTSPYISHVCVFGDRKPYLVALVTLDAENIQKLDIQNPHREEKIRRLVEGDVRELCDDLASYEQIKKIRILPEDFSIDNGLLTPTLKLKRREIYKRFAEDYEELYAKEDGFLDPK